MYNNIQKDNIIRAFSAGRRINGKCSSTIIAAVLEEHGSRSAEILGWTGSRSAKNECGTATLSTLKENLTNVPSILSYTYGDRLFIQVAMFLNE
jgi:hypothetical protein